jgi:hypothetical protein
MVSYKLTFAILTPIQLFSVWLLSIANYMFALTFWAFDCYLCFHAINLLLFTCFVNILLSRTPPVTLVRITETTPEGEPIEWFLATNLEVSCAEDCKKIVDYYVLRWRIERFHFVLKSGCNIEKTQQRSYEKLKQVIFIYSVISLYIMELSISVVVNKCKEIIPT